MKQSATRGAPPVTMTISGIMERHGWTRSTVYRKLKNGDIRAVKDGRRTKIDVASADQHVAALPDATFRSPRPNQALAADAARAA